MKRLTNEYLKEIQVNKPGKTVYALSSSEGSFDELILINNSDIIDDEEINDDGVGILKLKDHTQPNRYEYFIGKLKI
jgi:hypothetical protein